MRNITNKLNKNFLFNNKDYFMKTKYSLDSKIIKLIFFKKSGGAQYIYNLKPVEDGFIIELNQFQQLIPELFSNSEYDFKDYYSNKISLISQDIYNLASLLKLDIKFTANLYYESYSKFIELGDDLYSIMNDSSNSNLNVYAVNSFFIDSDCKQLDFKTKVYFKEQAYGTAVIIDNYKKYLLNKFVADPLGKSLDSLTFEDIKLIHILNYK